MIPIGIFVLMVLVLGLDFLGNNNLHGLDVFEWLVGVPAVAAVICWILFGAVDFVFAGVASARHLAAIERPIWKIRKTWE